MPPTGIKNCSPRKGPKRSIKSAPGRPARRPRRLPAIQRGGPGRAPRRRARRPRRPPVLRPRPGRLPGAHASGGRIGGGDRHDETTDEDAAERQASETESGQGSPRSPARQDGPRRGRERRPSGAGPGRRGGRGLPRDRAQGAGAGPFAGRPARPRGTETASETVVVLDFGSQFAQLIARRVRELDVYSELLPHDTPFAELERRGARAIILSGGPNSVYDDGAPRPDPAIWSGRIPVLGHLLRRPADGPRARRRRHRRRPPRIRAGQRDDHVRRRPVRRVSSASSRSG